MSAGLSPFITEFRPSGGGIASGIAINGVLYVNGTIIVPFPSGFIVQDANGNYWQISVDTDGALTTTAVTL